MSLESEVDDERVIIEISEPVTENDASDEVSETYISPTMKHAEVSNWLKSIEIFCRKLVLFFVDNGNY